MRTFPFVVAVVGGLTVALANLAIAQDVFYQDSRGNIYFEGMTPNEPYVARFRNSDARRDYSYIYLSKYSCRLHRLWNSAQFEIDTITIHNTEHGNLTFTASDLYRSGDFVPCVGGQPNLALDWTLLAPGVFGITLTEPCPSTYFYLGQQRCNGDTQTTLIRGLSAESYRVSNARPRKRFGKADACGFLRFPVSHEWPFNPNDRFDLYNPFKEIVRQVNRPTLPVKPILEIPRCYGGRKFVAWTQAGEPPPVYTEPNPQPSPSEPPQPEPSPSQPPTPEPSPSQPPTPEPIPETYQGSYRRATVQWFGGLPNHQYIVVTTANWGTGDNVTIPPEGTAGLTRQSDACGQVRLGTAQRFHVYEQISGNQYRWRGVQLRSDVPEVDVPPCSR